MPQVDRIRNMVRSTLLQGWGWAALKGESGGVTGIVVEQSRFRRTSLCRSAAFSWTLSREGLANLQCEPRDLHTKRQRGITVLSSLSARREAGRDKPDSEFGDGYRARFVGLQDRLGLQTYTASLMAHFVDFVT